MFFTPTVKRLETRDKLAQQHAETTNNYIRRFVLASWIRPDTLFNTGLTWGEDLYDCVRSATVNQAEIRQYNCENHRRNCSRIAKPDLEKQIRWDIAWIRSSECQNNSGNPGIATNVVDKIHEITFQSKRKQLEYNVMHPLGCLTLLQMRNHCFVSKRLGAPEWVRKKIVRGRGGKTKTEKATCLRGQPDCWMLFGRSLGFNSSSAFKF